VNCFLLHSFPYERERDNMRQGVVFTRERSSQVHDFMWGAGKREATELDTCQPDSHKNFLWAKIFALFLYANGAAIDAAYILTLKITCNL